MASPTNFDAVLGCYTHAANIAKPATSGTVDANARAAIADVLNALRVARIIGVGATTRTASVTTTLSSAGITTTDGTFGPHDVGASITGTGIPGGTTILSVTNATTATMSQNASAAGTVTATITTLAWSAPAAASSVWEATMRCWVHASAITDPTGGTADTQLRAAVGQVLTALRNGGVVAGGTPGGPSVWDEDTESWAFSAYTSPSGGATVDAAARTTVDSIAAALKSAGFLTQD